MKITFVSTFLNHHQLPFCNELLRLTDGNFTFVAIQPLETEQKELGYEDMNNYPFVIRLYEPGGEERAMKVCLESDIVIRGFSPFIYKKKCIENGIPVFCYHERPLKNGIIHAYTPAAIKTFFTEHTRYRNKKVYLLCAGAYTAADFHRVLAYPGKAYKWGYFPKVNRYEDFQSFMASKKPAEIVWTARFIPWKHPEFAVLLAERLKKDGYSFHITMLGNGKLLENIRAGVKEKGLEDYVAVPGAVPAENVRKYMEDAPIFIMTSDRNEGWGAVLNESMNSGCAVVVNHMIGAVPFMINDGENGLIYRDGDFEDFYAKVRGLLDDRERCEKLGKNAYETVINEWNPENAARKFYTLAEAVCSGEKVPQIFDDGICSKAPVLWDNWYNKKRK